jgi:hypothetical protein
MSYLKLLNLPRIPEELIAGIDPANPGKVMRFYRGDNYTIDGVEYNTVEHPFCEATPELESWLKENIYPEFNDVGVRFAYGSKDIKKYGTSVGIHSDYSRRYVLQYNLQHADGMLTFWKEKNQPVMRTEHVSKVDYNNLEMVESVFLPNHQWAIFDTWVLHSVEELSGIRISVQVSLPMVPGINLMFKAF